MFFNGLIRIILGGVIMYTTFQLPNTTFSTWLWDASTLQQSDEIITFLHTQKAQKIYVQIDPNIPPTHYAQFIKHAHEHHIDVLALDGAPTWGDREKRSDVLQYIQYVADFNTMYTKTAFDGLHVDIEPYLHPHWHTRQASVIEDFQQTMTLLKEHATRLHLPLEADIPFWFDEVRYATSFGEGILAEWLIQEMDAITIMAYRNTADAIVNITQQELRLGAFYNKPITIAVETMPSDEGSSVSFSMMSAAEFSQQIQKLQRLLHNEKAFAGIAVHHYPTWKTLINK